MRRYALLIASLAGLLLLLFLLVQWLEVPILTGPRPWLEELGPLAALAGVALLVADVVLPVPSSVVMAVHGALFGVLGGAALSLVGSVGAAIFAFALGRRGAPVVERLVAARDRRRIDRQLARWGDLLVLVTRPVPIVAEVVAVVAGASSMSWTRLAIAAAIGSLPAAFLYALAGATASDRGSVALVFVFVLAVSGIAWLLRRRPERASASDR